MDHGYRLPITRVNGAWVDASGESVPDAVAEMYRERRPPSSLLTSDWMSWLVVFVATLVGVGGLGLMAWFLLRPQKST